MLSVENLSLQYGDQTILDNLSFSIPKGRIIGLLGPNGAGKSSIIKVLAGLVFPKSGTLNFKGTTGDNFSDLREYCGYLIDSPTFYPFLTAKENLKLLKKISKSPLEVDELLDKVGLTDVDRKKVRNFSTGMKQRLAIAQALLRSPEILILDEPFNGLDPNGFQDLINLLRQLNDNGTTIFISSHLLNELEQFADAFILIHKGSVALNITKEELERSKKKVTFTFENLLTEETKAYVTNHDGLFLNDYKAVLRLSPNDIAEAVNAFVNFKNTPVNVETHTILQEKYFEIAV